MIFFRPDRSVNREGAMRDDSKRALVNHSKEKRRSSNFSLNRYLSRYIFVRACLVTRPCLGRAVAK